MTAKYPAATHINHGRNVRPRRLRRGPGTSLAGTLIFFTIVSAASAQSAIKTGLDVGAVVPGFEAPDQNGQVRSLKSILGPKGAMLVFYRSADW